MDNLDRITERVIKVSDELPLIKRYLPFIGTEEDLSRSSHVHLILAQLPNKTFFLHGFFLDEHDKYLSGDEDWKNALRVGPRHDLVDIMRKGNPDSFDQLLMLVTMFLYACPHNLDLIPVKPYASTRSFTNKVLDEILSKSQGYCIWGYQVSRLISIFERNSAVRRDLVRDFRLSRPNATEWMSSKYFDDGQSLLDVISERTWIRRPAADPPVSFAFRLYNLLFAGNQSGNQSD